MSGHKEIREPLWFLLSPCTLSTKMCTIPTQVESLNNSCDFIWIGWRMDFSLPAADVLPYPNFLNKIIGRKNNNLRMERIKVKVEGLTEEDYRYEGYCFMCLQPGTVIKKEYTNLLTILFSYLNVREKVELICEKCTETLAKFVKLCKILEKVRLEMDYLLGFIQTGILKSNDLNAPTNHGFVSIRESVLRKCNEKIQSPKAQIILQRTDISKFIKTESLPLTSECSDDWSPRVEDDIDEDSGSCSSEPSTAGITKVNNIKLELETDFSKARRIHKRTKTCTKCYKTFSRQSELILHNNSIHHSLRTIKCSTCSKAFNSKPDLRSHINSVHLGLRPYKCEICDKSFAQSNDLARHKEAIHLGLKPFKCSACPKAFTQSRSLRSHLKNIHLHFKPYKCDICDKAFAKAEHLRLHKATPHKPNTQTPISKMLPCQICGKTFIKINSLKRHEAYFHLEKMFSCNSCDKKFKERYHLTNHISAVYDKQRHHCQAPGCDKNYSNQFSLSSHYKLEHPDFTLPRKPPQYSHYSEKTKNGKKVFECNICRNKFKSVPSVKFHIKRMHGQEKFSCEGCGYTTPFKGNLERHIGRKHKCKEVVIKTD